MVKKIAKLENNKGFTLVELLVVIAIIAILAAVVAPNAFKAIDKSKSAALIEDVDAIKTAAFIFYADTGKFPTGDVSGNQPYDVWNEDSADVFVTGNHVNTPEGWDGPYLDQWPSKTPFGGCYTYRYLHDGAGGSIGWAVGNLVNIEDGTAAFPDRNTEVVYIRFNQDADRELKRDKVLELLKQHTNVENLYITRPGITDHNTGLITIVLR